MTYDSIRRFQLFEQYYGDFDFFEFYCKDLPARAFYKQLFPGLFNSFVFGSSPAFFKQAQIFNSGGFIKKATHKTVDIFAYGGYYLKDIAHEEFTLIDSTSFLKQFEAYRNEVHNSFVPPTNNLLSNLRSPIDNALKFVQENVSADLEFIDIFQFLDPIAQKAPGAYWDFFKCFIGFNWKMKRVYRIDVSSE